MINYIRKKGPRHFQYNYPLEINNEKTPIAWKEKLFQLKIKCYKNIMKVVSSLKSLKKRDINCKVVRRRGKLYVINKKNPKFKARQG